MADVNPDDIKAYGNYLASQGHSKADIAAYTDYLSAHHEANAGPSVLDKQVPYIGGTPRNYIKSGLGALPIAGMAAGGLAGAPTGPIGAAGGAALGGAAGEGLKHLGEEYILGEKKEPGDYLKAEGSGLIHGAEAEMGGQLGAKAIKAVSDVPSLLKEIGSVSKGEAVIYDPFLKTSRAPGQTIEELKNIGTEIKQTPDIGKPGLLQKGAQLASSAIDKTQEGAEAAGKVAEKVLPLTAKIGGALIGHFPGYAAGEALTSRPAREAFKSGVGLLKDASGNIVISPEGLGLLTNSIKQASEK